MNFGTHDFMVNGRLMTDQWPIKGWFNWADETNSCQLLCISHKMYDLRPKWIALNEEKSLIIFGLILELFYFKKYAQHYI